MIIKRRNFKYVLQNAGNRELSDLRITQQQQTGPQENYKDNVAKYIVIMRL